MPGSREVSIRRKLLLLSVTACGTTLVLILLGMGTHEFVTLGDNAARRVRVLAAVIGSNSAGSLTFGDAKSCEKSLGALRHEENVGAACVYGKNGKVFARYLRPEAQMAPPAQARAEGLYFETGYIEAFADVRVEEKKVGVVWVRADRSQQWASLAKYGVVALGVGLASALVALMLAWRMQRGISAPLSRLADTARKVREGQGSALRADGSGVAELGVLAEAVNSLLDEVEGHDTELQQVRSELEERVEERTAELARAVRDLENSNEELERFAYVASHDLQEPLRKVQTFGDRIRDRYGDQIGGRGADYLARMQDAATRMQHLIDGLLDYSRVTTKAQPFKEVDLNEVVRGVLSDLEVPVARERAWIEASPLPSVESDSLQMRQLFQNLLGNALKYRRPDVSPVVNIRSELVEGAGGPDGRFRITIADNGIGFEPEYAERIFGVFQRLHGRGDYSGAGIGLSVCRKIVERHGGTLTAEGEPDKGSKFHIELPAKQKSQLSSDSRRLRAITP